MKSNHAKVSHKILGKPMIEWVVDAAVAGGCNRIIVVVGSHADEVRAIVEGSRSASVARVECVEQTERLGTGHAVKVALEACAITEGPVVVLNGDLPLIQGETIRLFAESVADALTLPRFSPLRRPIRSGMAACSLVQTARLNVLSSRRIAPQNRLQPCWSATRAATPSTARR